MINLKQRIIDFLADYPESEFYGQEIARKLRCSRASTSKILRKVLAEKIVYETVRGHMKFYRINAKNPAVKKTKIGSAIEKLAPLASRLGKVSQKIILFGSASRGEQTTDSDLDLFVLSKDKAEARKIIMSADRRLRIKAVIKNQTEWSEMEINEPEFYQEIRSGIILYEYVPRI